MKVAVLGSTGLVGKNVLKLLARLPQVVRVFCPVRNVPDLKDLGILEGTIKIDFKQVDFEQDNDATRLFFYAGFTGCDAVVCCLGTTRKQAGSKAAQEKIDVRLPLMLAAIAKKAGVKNFLCVSAMGADSHSPYFYNRLKGQLEEGLDMIGFETLTLVRPSLLLGKHKDRRFGEELLQKTIGAHPEWIPAYVRPVHAETVAAHLVTSLLKPPTDHVCATDGRVGKRIIYNRVLAQTKVDDLF
ncbi:NAD(P)H-binding protein [Fibrobacter succinogenes]|uniref:NAD(P)H-binding protein n=1 Tax=Fibrobacter succinogenes TaxID=833 RepID=UPI0013D51496|nr:NAD(P)H-binding protein [Fibrobacter succinogenes]